MFIARKSNIRIISNSIAIALFLLFSGASNQLHADIFNDLVDIIVKDVEAGGATVAAVEDIMPDPLDLELEHSGGGGFDVDITPTTSCDFFLRIGHFAPIDGFTIGRYDWTIADIHMRNDFGEIMTAVITDIEIPAPELNEMPTESVVITDTLITIRTGEFASDSGGAFSEYLVKVAVIGDVNEDCEVNLLDVGSFVFLLGTGGYSVQADINQDGTLNLLDVGAFIALLGS